MDDRRASVSSRRSFASTKYSSNPIDCLSDFDASSPTKSMSIKDHYHASVDGVDEKKMNYIPGLSNYSNVVLGDDRIKFTKSMTACVYDSTDVSFLGDAARSQTKFKSENDRRKEYTISTSKCGGSVGVDNIENLIKLKLQQRKKFGLFQLRKNFRYHDRSNTGYVDIFEFTRSLELLGLQFTQDQYVALFARSVYVPYII
jgi:hypothetical protein